MAHHGEIGVARKEGRLALLTLYSTPSQPNENEPDVHMMMPTSAT